MLVLQQLVSGQQQCGTVGRVGSERPGNNRERNQFFIDRGNRAECAGMITSISYCYHRPPDAPIVNEYLTIVAVYRPASGAEDENMFTNVSSPITIQKLATELETDAETDFACSVFNLPQPVPMATGDVFGACVFDPPNDNTTFRLDIVSRAAGDIVRTNTHQNSNSPAGCSATTVPSSFDASGTDNRGSTDRSLHLWANIGISFNFYHPH